MVSIYRFYNKIEKLLILMLTENLLDNDERGSRLNYKFKLGFTEKINFDIRSVLIKV